MSGKSAELPQWIRLRGNDRRLDVVVPLVVILEFPISTMIGKIKKLQLTPRTGGQTIRTSLVWLRPSRAQRRGRTGVSESRKEAEACTA